MSKDSLNFALRNFEAVEANLVKAERLLHKIESTISKEDTFESNPDYEDNCRDLNTLINVLPKIDGWKPEITLMELDEIAEARLQARDVGVFEAILSVERQIEKPSKLLREYRYRFNLKRRELVKDAIARLIETVDKNIHHLGPLLNSEELLSKTIIESEFEKLRNNVAQINTLLGSSLTKPTRWSDLDRHLRFGELHDLHDIIKLDWPTVKEGLYEMLYDENEPVPTKVGDLGALTSTKPRGPVATKLKWESLTDEEFERLIFNLVSSTDNYENPEWLMKTNAPDRGRDLSMYRVYQDPLSGTIRQRVIIQCKHWQSKSVSVADIATLKEQMRLCEPPKVNVHIIATSGRFTSDAVTLVEKHNQSDSALQIEMWPESRLEFLLASKPDIIAEFRLR